MLKLENYFAWCLFGGAILGFLFPVAFFWGHPYVSYFLMLGLFLGFIRVDWKEITHLKSGGKRLALYTLISVILLPILFYISTPWLGYELRLGMFLILATCAGVNAPLIASFLQLRILWATVFVILTSLLVTFTLPFMTAFFFQESIDIDIFSMILFIGKIIFIPAILASLAQRYAANFVKKIQQQAGNIGTLNIAFFTAVLVSINIEYIKESGLSWNTLYALIGMFFVFFIRFLAGFILPSNSSDERWTNALMFALANNSLVVLLAAEFLTPEIFWIVLLSQIPWILVFPSIRIARNNFISS